MISWPMKAETRIRIHILASRDSSRKTRRRISGDGDVVVALTATLAKRSSTRSDVSGY